MEKFKILYEYSDKLCDYYVEGFELFQKYLAKHHPGLDFSKLDMEVVENEILVDCQSTEGVGEGGEVAAVDEAVRVNPSFFALPKVVKLLLLTKLFELTHHFLLCLRTFFLFFFVRQKLYSFGLVVLSMFILLFEQSLGLLCIEQTIYLFFFRGSKQFT